MPVHGSSPAHAEPTRPAMKLAPQFPRPFNAPSVSRSVLPDQAAVSPILSGCPTPTDRGAAISDHSDGSDGRSSSPPRLRGGGPCEALAEQGGGGGTAVDFRIVHSRQPVPPPPPSRRKRAVPPPRKRRGDVQPQSRPFRRFRRYLPTPQPPWPSRPFPPKCPSPVASDRDPPCPLPLTLLPPTDAPAPAC